jgi:hypothetical protein
MAIKYTKEIYDIDISNIVKSYMFIYSDNVFEKYETKYPRSRDDDGSRGYFQAIGRNYFLSFLDKYSENSGYDALQPLVKYSVVHHIYPLVFSQDNSLLNLIQLSDFSHKLLHMNPNESNKISCFKSLDYLGYLYSYQKFCELYEKYRLNTYADKPSFGIKVIKVCMEEEMKQFYTYMSNGTSDGLNNLSYPHQEVQR